MRTFTDNRGGAGRVIRYSDTANPTDRGLNGLLEVTDAEAAAGHHLPLIAALEANGYGRVQGA